MEQILLINPRKRNRKMATRRKSHRRPSAAQLRARAKFAAMARGRARKANPSRRRKAHHVVHRARRRNPIHLFSAPRRHRRRRNPISTAGMKGLLMPAVFGAAGAVLVDAAMTYIPLPGMLKTGTLGMVTKAGAALLLGTAGRKVFGARATDMAVGSLTVQTYALLRQFLPASITGLGYVSPGAMATAVPLPGSNPAQLAGVDGMGMYVGGGMRLGEYVH